jgi:hypothetical protein
MDYRIIKDKELTSHNSLNEARVANLFLGAIFALKASPLSSEERGKAKSGWQPIQTQPSLKGDIAEKEIMHRDP